MLKYMNIVNFADFFGNQPGIMATTAKQLTAIITMLCVLAHGLGACCTLAHAGCSHSQTAADAFAEPVSPCHDNCCSHGAPKHDVPGQGEKCPGGQSPCSHHDHRNCEHCVGNCLQTLVTVLTSLDLVNALPVMITLHDASPCAMADSSSVDIFEGRHSFLRFDVPIFSQNQSLLI